MTLLSVEFKLEWEIAKLIETKDQTRKRMKLCSELVICPINQIIKCTLLMPQVLFSIYPFYLNR